MFRVDDMALSGVMEEVTYIVVKKILTRTTGSDHDMLILQE